MHKKISLNGIWQFCLDTDKKGLAEHFETQSFSDTISLPNTVALAKKGQPQLLQETGHLTDPYCMEGYTWYKKVIELPFSSVLEFVDWQFTLLLERTRISHIWVDGQLVGNFDSFVSPHKYDLTPWIHSLTPEITIMVSNTDYKVPGGHMTSPDTQTNWNGILGDISILCTKGASITSAHAVYASKDSVDVTVSMKHFGSVAPAALQISAKMCRIKESYQLTTAKPQEHTTDEMMFSKLCDITGEVSSKTYPIDFDSDMLTDTFSYKLTDAISSEVQLWDEFDPNLYQLTLSLIDKNGNEIDAISLWYGHRSFVADGDHFAINGRKTFLRGKHDGMIFPLTGFAPMSIEGWLTVMKTAKEFGINHYRFHTCCPPEAAFVAADLLGIYMEPEIPFWGTFNGPGDEGYNETAQLFLREEGFRILEQFSSHPSFCMMSMGNELWGNPSAINDLLAEYKAFRPHILFTQGSNNFQWVPNIQPMEDFFCGVRFTIDRQIRGSYAMCDKPLGHVQTAAPGTRFCYEAAIHPSYQKAQSTLSEDGTIEIQYGTGVKRVKLTDAEAELIPSIPVVSHEIGQYCTYPDFKEIDAYTGVLKAENFSVFKKRLEEKRLGSLAEAYFRNSGALAVACYKDELETALRTPSLAGFQILDIQDFSGQGTALVGILNAFMENKGLISAGKWRTFCSEAVIQAEFDSYVVKAGDTFAFTASIAFFGKNEIVAPTLVVSFQDAKAGTCITSIEQPVADICEPGRHILGDFSITIPTVPANLMGVEYTLTISLKDTDIRNQYTLWSYDAKLLEIADKLVASDTVSSDTVSNDTVSTGLHSTHCKYAIASSIEETLTLAKEFKNVLLFLSDEENPSSIEGTYCTDFWCYPMFRSISESMGKEIPVGTLGLLIDNTHPALSDFLCKTYSTPQWYSIVTASRSTILDDTDILPIVQTIDNFERNHRLGLLYEVYLTDLQSNVLICTSNLPRLVKEGHVEAACLFKSLTNYLSSCAPSNGYQICSDAFQKILQGECA